MINFKLTVTYLSHLKKFSTKFSKKYLNFIFNLKIKQIEKADSVLTSAQQIERLNRPGSKYFNLNPFDVLQVVHYPFFNIFNSFMIMLIIKLIITKIIIFLVLYAFCTQKSLK